MGFPDGSVAKNLLVNAGDTGDSGLIPGSGRFPRGVHGTPISLPGESPWTEEAGGLQSRRLQRGGHD